MRGIDGKTGWFRRLKKWNLTKMHALIYSSDQAKGTSRSYDMKLNEKMHAPIRKYKIVQISRTLHLRFVLILYLEFDF